MTSGTIVAEGKRIIGQVLENPDGSPKPGAEEGTTKVLARGGREILELDLSKYRVHTFR